jgi:hypothetical protein
MLSPNVTFWTRTHREVESIARDYEVHRNRQAEEMWCSFPDWYHRYAQIPGGAKGLYYLVTVGPLIAYCGVS